MKEAKNRNNEQEIKEINDVSSRNDSFSLFLNHSLNVPEHSGKVCLSYRNLYSYIDKETYEEIGVDEDFCEWYEAGTEIEEKLKGLAENKYNDCLSDCRVSLAEYSAPELDKKNISQIRTCLVHIPENEKFYYSTLEDAREALLEYCRVNEVPEPSEIQYAVGDYYIKWKFENGFSGSEILLWKFVQEVLREIFAGVGATVCDEETAMLLASGFRNSDYVGFDLAEKVTTIYGNDEIYSSPLEFVAGLPLTIDGISEYRRTREKCRKLAAKVRSSRTIKPAMQSLELDAKERAELWLDSLTRALRDDNCNDEEYRLWQGKITGNPKIRKNYKWLRINSTSGLLPKFYSDRDSWISAATYYSRWKGKGYIASINCNFLIIKWDKSELGYIPTPEQGITLVLSRCQELGLPEPDITLLPDGLEVKWYWRDRMQKVFYDDDPYHNRFNQDWEAMQRELYKKFWYLGVDLRKGATAMFSLPGSVNTTKSLKTDDRIIRDIHKGITVSSYREIQRVLGLKETNSLEVSEEMFGLKWEVFRTYNRELAEDWLADVLKIHQSGRNWVCVGMIDAQGKWRNHWERVCNLPSYLMRLVKRPEFDLWDIYVSQGEFFSRSDRHVKNLAAIRVCFVDLDYKLMKQYRPEITENPTPAEWLELVKEHCEKYKLPLPNDAVSTGGGLHLKWIFDETVSRPELAYWQYCQKLLLAQFKTLGADPASVDGARVLRLVGTKNHKDSPDINNRNVFVINREIFSGQHVTLRGLIEGLEKSEPENPEEFNACISEWQKVSKKLSRTESDIIRPEPERITELNSEDFRITDGEYWRLNTLHHHRPRATWLSAEISGATRWIETYQLHEALRSSYGMPNFLLSLSELTGKERKESKGYIEYIPCNYVVLSNCPGATFEEQKANIFRRCCEYREVGIFEPNQIIQVGRKLIVEWTYSSVLPGKALSRWQRTQEFLCRHFEDWGAMENPEYLKATALLPVPGFVYEGETARLVYSELEKKYTFNRLATAVLNWTQKECKEYQEAKEAKKAILKIALTENIDQLKQAVSVLSVEANRKYGDFRTIAQMRFVDILHWLELQKDSNGDVPQKVRELSVFWALVSAKQAGLIRSYEEFCEKAQKLIEFCGNQFETECTVETLKTAYTKNYFAKTTTLIEKLQITPEAQKEMKVLLIGKRVTAKARQKREDYLAEHDQERRKPWIALGISRRTYFRWKKAGKLSPQPLVNIPVTPVQKNDFSCGTGLLYIMTRARVAFIRALCQAELLRLSECEWGVQYDNGAGVYRRFTQLPRVKVPQWLRVKSLMYFKRRRKSKRKRKRKRG